MPRRHAVRHAALAAALLVIGTGCPLPIPHKEPITPPVTGVVRRSDGSRVAGMRIALAPTVSDSACSAATLQATTDTSGRFALPGTSERRRVVWLVPLLDRISPPYAVCAGRGDSLALVHVGGQAIGGVRRASLTCLDWVWQGVSRLTCSTAKDGSIVEGGAWRTADASGTLRVIIAEPGAFDERARRATGRPLVVVQWLATGGDTTATRVVAERPLPVPERFAAASAVRLVRHEGEWVVTLGVFGPHPLMLPFALGAPGEIRALEIPCAGSPLVRTWEGRRRR